MSNMRNTDKLNKTGSLDNLDNFGSNIEPVLKMTGLSFKYSDDSPVLDNIDLEISIGEKVGIIGPNGAGKTTLFLLACGVLKKSDGDLHLFGEDVIPGKFRHEVGLVFQNTDDQLFSPTVKDDVAFGPRNLGLSREEVEARVSEAFRITGIEKLAAKPPHHLSGGEKRMVAIASVLAMDPKLVIYDEPTSNLDIRFRRKLIQFLQKAKQTMLIASHDLEFILEVCDRVILLDEGRIITEGDPKIVMKDSRLMERHGLEKPHSLITHIHEE